MSSGCKFFLHYSHLNHIPQPLAQVTGHKKCYCCQNCSRSPPIRSNDSFSAGSSHMKEKEKNVHQRWCQEYEAVFISLCSAFLNCWHWRLGVHSWQLATGDCFKSHKGFYSNIFVSQFLFVMCYETTLALTSAEEVKEERNTFNVQRLVISKLCWSLYSVFLLGQ